MCTVNTFSCVKPVCVILFKHPVHHSLVLRGCPPWGAGGTESQAYTDIHTKDRPALAGGPNIDKCVFCLAGGGWGGGGREGGRG